MTKKLNEDLEKNTEQETASQGRRALLKTLLAGGAAAALLPEKWTRPVLDKILVPAHAQGSIPDFTGVFVSRGGLGHSGPGGLFERLVDAVVPTAHAQESDEGSCADRCIELQVYANTSVVGYVEGCFGVSTWDPTTREIAPFNVSCDHKHIVPGTVGTHSLSEPSYSLSNCVISSDGTAVEGFISAPSNLVACSHGLFTADKTTYPLPSNSMAQACFFLGET